jgi:hypothetical protein
MHLDRILKLTHVSSLPSAEKHYGHASLPINDPKAARRRKAFLGWISKHFREPKISRKSRNRVIPVTILVLDIGICGGDLTKDFRWGLTSRSSALWTVAHPYNHTVSFEKRSMFRIAAGRINGHVAIVGSDSSSHSQNDQSQLLRQSWKYDGFCSNDSFDAQSRFNIHHLDDW